MRMFLLLLLPAMLAACSAPASDLADKPKVGSSYSPSY
jgi:hypothetical protein